jgi:apolipoprotein N-acyltransferase
MAKRRHLLNPAKVKRDAAAMALRGPAESEASRPAVRGRLTAPLLAVLGVVLLSAAFAPLEIWPLAYVALVPWVLSLVVAPTRRWALLFGWASGLLFWAGNLYWLSWVTLVGYCAAVVYLSAYWWATAAILRAAMRRRWPMWIVLPVVWVALEYVRAFVISGFPWFYLAHTQYAQTRLIQVADVVGQYGVSLLVAMVNGAVVDLIGGVGLLRQAGPRERPRLRLRLIWAIAAPVVLAAGLLLYGTWQLGRETKSPGPVIGIVQQSYPISLTGREATPEEIFGSHLAATAGFVGSPVDVVIWPETMLPRGLNPAALQVQADGLGGAELRSLAAKFFGPKMWNEEISEAVVQWNLKLTVEGGVRSDGEEELGLRHMAGRMTAMAKKLGCPILSGGTTIEPGRDPVGRDDLWVVRNGVVWFDPTGKPAPTYAKMHLVPFSEYVPYKRSWPGFHRLLRWFVPPVMEQLDPGTEATRFELARPSGTWRLVSPICYEGTFARVCRQMVYQDGRKKADVIANLSNDGWFVYQSSGGRDRGSTEHALHLSHYCFRAIENRTPVVRAVNTGISASIDSDGRIVAEVRHGRRRTVVPGTLLLDGARRNEAEYLPGHGPKVLVDSRTSWYSRCGDVFAAAVCVAAAALTGWLAWKRPKSTEGATN